MIGYLPIYGLSMNVVYHSKNYCIVCNLPTFYEKTINDWFFFTKKKKMYEFTIQFYIPQMTLSHLNYSYADSKLSSQHSLLIINNINRVDYH